MDLKTQIDKLVVKIDDNIEANEAEKLYYQTLALTELRKNHIPTLPTDENLQLLSPAIGSASMDGLYQQSTYNNTNGCFALFGNSTSLHSPHNQHSTMWWKIDFPKVFQEEPNGKQRIVYKYSLQNSGTHYAIKSWTVEVSDDDKNWFQVDERIDSMPATPNIGRTFVIQNPLAGKLIRFSSTAVQALPGAGAYFVLSSSELFGKILEI